MNRQRHLQKDIAMKGFIVIALLCGCAISSPSQTLTVDSLAARVARFGTGLPQEKVYLHIDNTCYFVGDTIRYKGYVMRSDRSTLTDLSKIMYVELLTPDGFLVERQQLELTDGTAHGAFTLTDSLYAGYYELRAYTRWMLNFGRYEHPHSRHTEDMFYNRQMAKDFFRDYDKLYSRVFPVFDRPEETGRYPKDMTLRPMRRYYKARQGKPGIDLRFYPEGGHLVAGTTCRVAFELNDEDGKQLDAELAITDDKGQVVARQRTTDRGRGVFTLPEIPAGTRYKASLHCNGYDYETDLPEVEHEGYALYIKEEGDTLRAVIQGQTARDERLGLQIQCNGVSRFFRALPSGNQRHDTVAVPLRQLSTGVNQLTLFNADGRIYADRLFFVNRHDHDEPRLSVEGLQHEYEPFAPIDLTLKLAPGESPAADVSLSVRDHATDEATYDNGTMLTEMLLASEVKGFVENPGWYFEQDDSLHRAALDLLLMVQGWRRHDWRTMAGLEDDTSFEFLPEKFQTLSGSVHRTYALLEDTRIGESVYIPALDKSMDLYTTAPRRNELFTLQDLYAPSVKPLSKEVLVSATFIQNQEIVEAAQTSLQGKFYMPSAKVYENHVLFLSASDSTRSEKFKRRMKNKGFLDEQAYPEFYVKLDPFFPVFPKPYSYYQDAAFEEKFDRPDSAHADSFTDRRLAAVTVRSKRGGLRKLDFSKPAIVADAYDAFNLTADYGLNGGMYDWRTFSRQVALAYFGDMGMHRHYFVEERYDGMLLEDKPEKDLPPLDGTGADYNFANPFITTKRSDQALERYRRLRHLGKLYIYTDYVPREQGSWKYKQANQPDVVIDYHLLPDGGKRPTYRDRRYAARGFALCTEFYSPDYSRKPLPGHKDHRRTLYWTPKVKFNDKGEATIRLYNNGKKTAIAVEAEGITADGRPVAWKSGD